MAGFIGRFIAFSNNKIIECIIRIEFRMLKKEALLRFSDEVEEVFSSSSLERMNFKS